MFLRSSMDQQLEVSQIKILGNISNLENTKVGSRVIDIKVSSTSSPYTQVIIAYTKQLHQCLCTTTLITVAALLIKDLCNLECVRKLQNH